MVLPLLCSNPLPGSARNCACICSDCVAAALNKSPIPTHFLCCLAIRVLFFLERTGGNPQTANRSWEPQLLWKWLTLIVLLKWGRLCFDVCCFFVPSSSSYNSYAGRHSYKAQSFNRHRSSAVPCLGWSSLIVNPSCTAPAAAVHSSLFLRSVSRQRAQQHKGPKDGSEGQQNVKRND